MTKTQITDLLSRAVDSTERLMVECGLLDQLSFLVGKTSLVRTAILGAAGTIFGASAVQGQIGQALIAATVAVATGLVGVFIDRIRRKYSRQTLSLARAAAPEIGVKVDDFVGPRAVAAITQLVAGR